MCIWRQIVFRQNLLVRQWACWGNSKKPSYQIHLLDTWCCQSVIQENCDEPRLKLWKFSGAYRAEQIKSKETMDKLPINQTQMNFKDSLARWVLWTEGSLIYTHGETHACLVHAGLCLMTSASYKWVQSPVWKEKCLKGVTAVPGEDTVEFIWIDEWLGLLIKETCSLQAEGLAWK